MASGGSGPGPGPSAPGSSNSPVWSPNTLGVVGCEEAPLEAKWAARLAPRLRRETFTPTSSSQAERQLGPDPQSLPHTQPGPRGSLSSSSQPGPSMSQPLPVRPVFARERGIDPVPQRAVPLSIPDLPRACPSLQAPLLSVQPPGPCCQHRQPAMPAEDRAAERAPLPGTGTAPLCPPIRLRPCITDWLSGPPPLTTVTQTPSSRKSLQVLDLHLDPLPLSGDRFLQQQYLSTGAVWGGLSPCAQHPQVTTGFPGLPHPTSL